jgi:hypothetical protein
MTDNWRTTRPRQQKTRSEKSADKKNTEVHARSQAKEHRAGEICKSRMFPLTKVEIFTRPQLPCSLPDAPPARRHDCGGALASEAEPRRNLQQNMNI